MKSVIFLNNDINAIDINALKNRVKTQINPRSDYIIAVDGGYQILSAIGLTPNIIIGDLDSIDSQTNPIHETCEIIQLNKEKDFSDFDAAIRHIPTTSSEMLIYGITGGRSDHAFMNLMACKKLTRPSKMVAYPQVKGLISSETCFFLTANQSLSLTGNQHTLSCFSLDANGTKISSRGLYYELDHNIIPFASSLGLSNEMVAKETTIDCHQGELLIICQGELEHRFTSC